MRFVRALFAALVGALPLVAAAQPSREPIVYDAPAGNLPTGRLGADPFWAVLPSGRLVKPAGRSAIVGIDALGVALAPDGRYAIVSNGDARLPGARSLVDPSVAGGSTLTVVDVATMRVASQYSAPNASFFSGIVAARDPLDPSRTLVLAAGGSSGAVFVLTLDVEGRLSPDRVQSRIALPAAGDPMYADAGHSFPATIVLSRDGATAYAIGNESSAAVAIDLRRRELRASASVGFFPFGATALKDALLVCDEGLMRYGKLAQATLSPAFRTPPADIQRASSLAFDAAFSTASLAANSAVQLPMDQAPDGTMLAGGEHRAAVVADPAGTYAYVALASVDRIAVVSLEGRPRVLGGLDLRLFPLGPFGTQPVALALSNDGKRLYVALAGLNAIAVLDASDPVHLKRLGLIPTGWRPAALALSSDDASLYVTNQKGFGSDFGFTGDGPTATDAGGHVQQVRIDSRAVWSTLQRIDLSGLNMVRETYTALGSARSPSSGAPSDVVPALGGGASSRIKHVVMIVEESKTFDAMLGDLVDGYGRKHGNADPSMVAFDASVTPNLHALARSYALADNFYADAQESGAAHQALLGGIASDYTERMAGVRTAARQDPEDYSRFGSIFNSLALHNISFRDYGDQLCVSGYDDGMNPDPKVDDPGFVDVNDRLAPTQGLGGLYGFDVPAPAILNGRVDERYPGWNLRIRDERRAREFVRDFDRLAALRTLPRFTLVWLPDDRGGKGRYIPPLAEEVADGDRALGIVVSAPLAPAAVEGYGNLHRPRRHGIIARSCQRAARLRGRRLAVCETRLPSATATFRPRACSRQRRSCWGSRRYRWATCWRPTSATSSPSLRIFRRTSPSPSRPRGPAPRLAVVPWPAANEPGVTEKQLISAPFVKSSTARLRDALLAPPGAAFDRVPPIQGEPSPIFDRAQEQHGVLDRTLRDCGVVVHHLERDEGSDPDGFATFVADCALVVANGAILLRPSRIERRRETATVEARLTELGIPILGRIEAPGLIDGGDLVVSGDCVFIGVPRHGTRSNTIGRAQLGEILGGLGMHVLELRLAPEIPRLASVFSAVGDDVVVAARDYVDIDAAGTSVQTIAIPRGDQCGAGLLTIGPRRAIANLRFRVALPLLRKAKLDILAIDLWEFGKAGAGPAALVLPLRRG